MGGGWGRGEGKGRNHNRGKKLCVIEEESIGNFIDLGG